MEITAKEIKDFWFNYWPENLMGWEYNNDHGIDIVDENGCFILDIIPINQEKWRINSNMIYDTNNCGELINVNTNATMSFEDAFIEYKEK